VLRTAYTLLTGKLERKEPLGRSGRRGQESIETFLTEMGQDSMNYN